MQIDNMVGLSQSLMAGIIGGAILFIYLSVQTFVDLRTEFQSSSLFQNATTVLVASVLLAVPSTALAAAIFCATFSVLNLILQAAGPPSITTLQSDLASGTLTLRIVSLVLLFKAVVILGRVADHWDYLGVGLPWGGRSQKLADMRSTTGERKPLPQLSEAVHYMDRDIIVAAQYGFYLAVLTLLWILNAAGVTSIIAVLLSFALLFIVDDWVLISDYYQNLNGRILQEHRLRIDIANAVIAPSAIWVAFASLLPGYALIASVVMVGSLVIRYLLAYDSPETKTADETAPT